MNTTWLRWMLPATLAALAAGCGGGEGRKPADSAPVAVATFRAGGAPDAAEMVLPGRSRAREEVTIAARIPARLTRLPLREGQHFRRGEVLARFEAEETKRAMDAARSGLSAASLRRDQARLQESRMDSLYSQRVAALRELEGAQMERRAADAAWEQARAGLEELTSGTAITAPFDGVVVRRHVDPGAGVGPGQPLLDVRSDATDEIEASVPEAQVERARSARVFFQVGEGPWRPAQIARLDGMVDFATRTRTVYLRPAGGAGRPEPGAYVRVKFEAPAAARQAAKQGRATEASGRAAGTEGAAAAGRAPGSSSVAAGPVTVPLSSLVRRGELSGVYVVRDGRATLRWLRLGRQAGAEVEVLAGLWRGEDVAVSPAGLADGSPVTVSR